MVLTEVVSTLCGSPKRTDFQQLLHLGGCGGLEVTDFSQLLIWAGVVGLK